MTNEQILDILTDTKIDVKHRIEFTGNIELNDEKTMLKIINILIGNGYSNITHTIFFKINQQHLMDNDPLFNHYCNRLKRYFRKIKILCHY